MARRLVAPLMKDVDPPADEEEGKTPLVEAVAIGAPSDPGAKAAVTVNNASKGKALDSDSGTEDRARRVFQVIAPSNLPKGYRLNAFIEETEEEVVVLVPSGGVKKSQTFEGKEAHPLIGEWSDDVCDCSPDCEGSFCYVAFCVAAVGWGIVAEKLGGRDRDSIMAKSMPWFMGALTLLWLIFHLLGCYTANLFLGLFLLLFVVTTRAAVRKKYKIPGNCFGDCVCAYFCACCTLLQSHRHMRRNGDSPLQGSSCVCGDHISVRATQV